MDNSIRLFIILLMSVVFTYCKKDTKTTTTPPQNIVSPVYEDLKPYCYFKTGSYWVYQDSLHPANYDSVYVIQHGIGWDTIKVETISCIKPGIYEVFGTKMKDAQNRTWNFICESSTGYRCTNIGRYIVKLDLSFVFQATNLNASFTYLSNYYNPGYVINSLISNYGDKMTFYGYYDSLEVNSKKFKSVICFNNYVLGSYVNTSFKINTNYLVSKNIGIIRKVELDSNRIWNLLRFNLVK